MQSESDDVDVSDWKVPDNLAGPTAELVWEVHRAALGGKSAVTGTFLPAKLGQCNASVQAAHYTIACFCAIVCGVHPPVPPAQLGDEEAEGAHKLAHQWADKELARRAEMMGEGHVDGPDTGRMPVDPSDEDHPEGFPNPGAGFCGELNIKAEAGSY